MTELLYFEDLHVGRVMRSASLDVTEAAIIAFAEAFDPQPFHTDPEAAKNSIFKGLAGSGWHTTALTMRLMAQGGLPLAGGIIGNGIDELRWPRPLRPGDTLRVESEVVEQRPSASRPSHGWVRMRNTTLNQHDQVVQSMVANLTVPRRLPATPS